MRRQPSLLTHSLTSFYSNSIGKGGEWTYVENAVWTSGQPSHALLRCLLVSRPARRACSTELRQVADLSLKLLLRRHAGILYFPRDGGIDQICTDRDPNGMGCTRLECSLGTNGNNWCNISTIKGFNVPMSFDCQCGLRLFSMHLARSPTRPLTPCRLLRRERVSWPGQILRRHHVRRRMACRPSCESSLLALVLVRSLSAAQVQPASWTRAPVRQRVPGRARLAQPAVQRLPQDLLRGHGYHHPSVLACTLAPGLVDRLACPPRQACAAGQPARLKARASRNGHQVPRRRDPLYFGECILASSPSHHVHGVCVTRRRISHLDLVGQRVSAAK